MVSARQPVITLRPVTAIVPSDLDGFSAPPGISATPLNGAAEGGWWPVRTVAPDSRGRDVTFAPRLCGDWQSSPHLGDERHTDHSRAVECDLTTPKNRCNIRRGSGSRRSWVSSMRRFSEQRGTRWVSRRRAPKRNRKPHRGAGASRPHRGAGGTATAQAGTTARESSGSITAHRSSVHLLARTTTPRVATDGGRQGRRTEGAAQPHRDPRTPPGAARMWSYLRGGALRVLGDVGVGPAQNSPRTGEKAENSAHLRLPRWVCGICPTYAGKGSLSRQPAAD